MFFRKNKKGISKILVALGNPGKKYENTRHNAGFLAMNYIEKEFNANIKKLRFKALTDEITLGNENVLLMKPQTFMNLSGTSVALAVNYYDLKPEDVLIISDDVNLDVGIMRIKRKGTHGGQNGIKNITQWLESDDIPRIKIGVGKKPHPDYDLSSWVLSKFSDKEFKEVNMILKEVPSVVNLIFCGNIEKAMNMYSK